jgi:glucosamine kinase
MKLIADSGSTKTNWCAYQGNNLTHFHTIGLNPFYITSTAFQAALLNGFNTAITKQITEIYFYGSGCIAGQPSSFIKQQLQMHFINAKTIEVHTDLLGAARGLLQNEPGLIAIFGTGSNSAIYNGIDFQFQIPSLGYLLGDEGSAAYFGKKILNYYFRNQLPPELEKCLSSNYPKNDITAVLKELHGHARPGFQLGQVAILFSNELLHPFVQQVAKDGFRDYFRNVISKYPTVKDINLNFVGSMASHFKPQLLEVCNQFQLNVGQLSQDPLLGLVAYHG